MNNQNAMPLDLDNDDEDLAELAIRMGGKPDPELERLQWAADFNDDLPVPSMVLK